ncbi:DUF5995 family protein [Actinoplanes sp. TFC3]|uniref:DUF5995 family protein n=1 Tax=Actinoplanes sp. TFC3 TaxID=1710355 RepID=UPI00128FE8C2|nr:DUF5995 family protein [Actinoplanes sp. TFC3]
MESSVWGPVQRDMSAVLAAHPDDVPSVVSQLTALQELLLRVPPLLGSNPLADFNKVYLTITTGVLEGLYEGRFQDPAFLARLDVEFAARYVEALRLWSEMSSGCSRAWMVLFQRVPGPDAHALSSAAAGINAHLNYDLPFALVTTFDHHGGDPIDDSDQHHDYLQINDIFAEQIPGLRRGFLDKWQVLIDMMNGDLDDWWQGEVVEYTRNVAWRNAKRLWAVRHDLKALTRERARLDHTAESLGKLLLSPMGAILQ